ncbi:MAG: glycosyltransferase N-terminal domain-containing protein [Weeksellaceae bacterium]
MRYLYIFFISIYGFAVFIASFFNSKARLWLKGRTEWKEKLKASFSPNDKVIWVHCSSLGEFEQGRPVMEKIKKQYPEHKLALSFFSPSGYEVRKNYKGADYIFYLPLDTPKNAKKLIEILQPEILILVKYEYWYNLLNRLQKAGIPVIVISAVIKEDSLFLRGYGSWFRKVISGISHFFVQDEDSKKRLHSIHIEQVTVSGDTRFDRVKEILKSHPKLEFIEKFKGNSKLIVVGSSWPEDEMILADYINHKLPTGWKVIFAPHNIDEKQIQQLISKLKKKTVRYTRMNENELENAEVLIVDTVGMLTKIYAYSDVSYVGGGFTKTGVHNTLEPAVFGVPLIFGPNYKHYFEAKDLVYSGAAVAYFDKNDFFRKMDELIHNEVMREERGKAGHRYIQNKPNATGLIMRWLNDKINLKP